MFNQECKQFETQLKSLINNCGLTVSTAYYIVKTCCLELELLYYKTIQEEQTSQVSTTTDNMGHMDIPFAQQVDD